jgi:hypothetical protein
LPATFAQAYLNRLGIGDHPGLADWAVTFLTYGQKVRELNFKIIVHFGRTRTTILRTEQ